jgi:nicotinate-nucleotide adenylyltransferase
MKKIAVYGGSFDPPHKGHRLLAENLAAFCGADKVLVIPTAMSPFKSSSGANAHDRLEMCKIAFSGELFQVSDMEIMRGGKSYTIDTINQVRELYPDSELYLFMGDDMLLSFEHWYKYDEILQKCTLVAACRVHEANKLSQMREYIKKLPLGEQRVMLCSCEPFEISSTQIRAGLKIGEKFGIDEGVYSYISSRGLYNVQK